MFGGSEFRREPQENRWVLTPADFLCIRERTMNFLLFLINFPSFFLYIMPFYNVKMGSLIFNQPCFCCFLKQPFDIKRFSCCPPLPSLSYQLNTFAII